MSRTTSAFFAAVALGATLVAAAVLAGPAARDGVRMSVDYTDLDLTTPAGVAVLHARIEKVAHAVCDAYDFGPEHSEALARHCVSEAIARAVASVGRSARVARPASAIRALTAG